MQLASFARRQYTEGSTPLVHLPRLTSALNGPQLFMKRDDLLGLAGGGNKTRKLEFLVAEALAQGADTLITCGAPQSNHCRLTLSAARREGMQCRLVLEERVPGSYHSGASGNNFLFSLLGAEDIRVVPAGTNLMDAMSEVASDISAIGRRPYVIPGGGSVPLGALGYVACVDEIVGQVVGLQIPLAAIICASGSGGTHAGLLAGTLLRSAGWPIMGVSVSARAEPQAAKVKELAQKTLRLLGVELGISSRVVEVLDGYVGDGYSLPTPEMTEAVRLVARHEGILLDPVYTGKAMAGLIDQIRIGRFSKSDCVLFIHTGGSPALYAYGLTQLRGEIEPRLPGSRL